MALNFKTRVVSDPGVQLNFEQLSTILGGSALTSLPNAGVDGQECYFLADATNGVVWHLKYRSASASAYKWEYVGGAELRAETDATVSTTSLTYVALTGGPSVTVPLAGDYVVEYGAGYFNSTTGGLRVSIAVGATAAVDADALLNDPTTSGGFNVSGHRARKKTSLTAGSAIAHRYSVSGGTGNWKNRYISVRPVRVG